MSVPTYSLEQLAALTNMTVEAITYYERIGLLDEQIATETRSTPTALETVDPVQFIECGTELGMDCNTLAALLILNDTYNSACLELAMKQQEKLVEQHANLVLMQALLDALIANHVTVNIPGLTHTDSHLSDTMNEQN